MEKTGQLPKRLWAWACVLLVIALAVFVRMRLLDTPLERDEGEYAYAGQLMLQGVPPYALAWNMKLPGVYAAYALIMAVFGETARAIHLGLLVINAVTIALVYALGRRLFGVLAGLVACLAYALLSVSAGVLGTQAHATHFVVIAALAGLLMLLRSLDTGSRFGVFAAGLLLGAGILMKQHGVFFAAFGALYLVCFCLRSYAPRRPVLTFLPAFVSGAAVPPAITCLIMWQAGVFSKFWFWTVTYAREYVSETPLALGLNLLWFNAIRVIAPDAAIWALAALGLMLAWAVPSRGNLSRILGFNRSAVWFATGFLLFSFLAICPGLYFREHYFVLMLPAVSLSAGAAAEIFRRQFGWPVATALALCAVAISIYPQWNFLFDATPVEASRKMYGLNPFPEAVRVADYIRAHTREDERIAILGSEPEIYFYAHRHSVSGFIYMYELMEAQPYALTMQNELIRDIENARPRYLVFVNVSASWLPRADSVPHIMQWSSGYLSHGYKLVGVADLFPWGTGYRWDEAGIGPPQSKVWVGVFRRNGS